MLSNTENIQYSFLNRNTEYEKSVKPPNMQLYKGVRFPNKLMNYF